MLGISVAQVFRTWAARAKVDSAHFKRNWVMDEAYELHETGAIDFAEYTSRQSKHFGVAMALEDWQAGWNAIWTEPLAQVVTLLPELAKRYALYAFSNTNAVHAAAFNQQYPDTLAHFEKLFLSHEIGARKPHPAAFATVCQYIDTKPQDVLFIDDNGDNVAGARTAGLDAHHLFDESDIATKLAALLD